MILRPYQLRAIEQTRDAFRAHRAVCLCLPVGAGKTVVAAEIARLMVSRGKRVLFLVHRRELAHQALARLSANGVEAGLIMAGADETPEAPVQVASIPTLIRRNYLPPADLVIFDECHHTPSQSWEELAKHYHGAFRLGLTATPFRLDGKGIGRVFTALVMPITVNELIASGNLVEPVVYAPPPPDLSGVGMRGGDYADLELLGERMATLTGDIIGHWKKHSPGVQTVAFACDVNHSQHIVEQFTSAGVPAEHIDGTTPKRDRAATLARLADDTTHVVSNCMILTEGWDLPTLRCAIMARPTMSLALHHQMIGRVMRPPGPVVVLDHAGNSHQHGLITDGFEVHLQDRETKTSEPPTKICPRCFAMVPLNTGICPGCGTEFDLTPQERELPKTEAGDLRIFVREESPLNVYRELLVTANEKRFSVGWARHRFKARWGKWPRYYQLEREIYTCDKHELEENEWGKLRCSKCCKTIREAARF